MPSSLLSQSHKGHSPVREWGASWGFWSQEVQPGAQGHSTAVRMQLGASRVPSRATGRATRQAPIMSCYTSTGGFFMGVGQPWGQGRMLLGAPGAGGAICARAL